MSQSSCVFCPDDIRRSLAPRFTRSLMDRMFDVGTPVPMVSDQVHGGAGGRLRVPVRKDDKIHYNNDIPLTCVMDINAHSSLWLGCLTAAESSRILGENDIRWVICAAHMRAVRYPDSVQIFRNLT